MSRVGRREVGSGRHLEDELGAPHGVHEARAEGAGDVGGAVAQQLVVHVRLEQRQRILCQAPRSCSGLQHAEACTAMAAQTLMLRDAKHFLSAWQLMAASYRNGAL